jgi:hypothetical protein
VSLSLQASSSSVRSLRSSRQPSTTPRGSRATGAAPRSSGPSVVHVAIVALSRGKRNSSAQSGGGTARGGQCSSAGPGHHLPQAPGRPWGSDFAFGQGWGSGAAPYRTTRQARGGRDPGARGSEAGGSGRSALAVGVASVLPVSACACSHHVSSSAT